MVITKSNNFLILLNNWFIRLIIFFLNGIIYVENRGDIVDIIIIFFRDILSGPLYVFITIINSILICSCIGYMGERYLNDKKKNKITDANSSLNNVVNTPLGSDFKSVGTKASIDNINNSNIQ